MSIFVLFIILLMVDRGSSVVLKKTRTHTQPETSTKTDLVGTTAEVPSPFRPEGKQSSIGRKEVVPLWFIGVEASEVMLGFRIWGYITESTI